MSKYLFLAIMCLTLSPALASYLKKSDLKSTPAAKTAVTHFGMAEFSKGLNLINPYLKPSDLVNITSGAACADRLPWEHCNQYVSLFSGLQVLRYTDSGSIVFLGLTDRGPNVECSDFADEAESEAEDPEAEPVWQGVVEDSVKPESIEVGQAFNVARFSPAFFELALDTATGKINMLKSCYLKNKFGYPVGGLSNNPGLDNEPYCALCNARIGYKSGGLDTEDIAVLPKRGLMVVADEYSSIAVVKGFKSGDSCGQVLARYVPKTSPLTEANAKYPVYKVLPAIFGERRKNRGFENVAVLPNEKTLIAMLQSSMGDDVDEAEPSHVITAIKMDISSVSKPVFQGVYLYLADKAEGSSSWLNTDNEAKDIKVSGFSNAGPVLGLPDNYPIVLAIERAKAQVKIYLVDFSKATDVWGTYGGDPLKYDKLGGYTATVAALKAKGIKTARKALVVDSGLTKKGTPLVEGWKATDKVEGVTILNKCTIALGTDNDFGYADDQSTLSVIRLSKCLDTIYKEM